METVSVRIPKKLKEEIEEIAEIEKIDRANALRKVLEIGINEWKKEYAVKLLAEGKVTLWKAASIAGVSIWEMLDIIEAKGISLPIRAEDVLEDIKAAL